jgi:hypothetical protein
MSLTLHAASVATIQVQIACDLCCDDPQTTSMLACMWLHVFSTARLNSRNVLQELRKINYLIILIKNLTRYIYRQKTT